MSISYESLYEIKLEEVAFHLLADGWRERDREKGGKWKILKRNFSCIFLKSTLPLNGDSTRAAAF